MKKEAISVLIYRIYNIFTYIRNFLLSRVSVSASDYLTPASVFTSLDVATAFTTGCVDNGTVDILETSVVVTGTF